MQTFFPSLSEFRQSKKLLESATKSSSPTTMAYSPSKIAFRVGLALVILFISFYVGRPLYWKLSATIHEIHENKQTVKEGISKFVLEAQKRVGWYFDESDSGFLDDLTTEKVVTSITRKILEVNRS